MAAWLPKHIAKPMCVLYRKPSICCISPLVTRGSVSHAVFDNVFSNILFYGSVILLQGGAIRFCSSFFMQFFMRFLPVYGLQAGGSGRWFMKNV